MEILNCIYEFFLDENLLKIMNFSFNSNTIVCSIQEPLIFSDFTDPPVLVSVTLY